MQKSALLKKFFRAEDKMSQFEDKLSATEHLARVKSVAKKSSLPPTLPWSEIALNDEVLLSEVSTIINRKFNSIYFSDESASIEEVRLTLEFVLELAQIIGNLDHYLIFKKEDAHFFLDLAKKDVCLKLRFELLKDCDQNLLSEFVSNFSRKFKIILNPYGSTFKISETENIIDSKRSLSLLFTINRLEHFTHAEIAEKASQVEPMKVKEGVFNV